MKKTIAMILRLPSSASASSTSTSPLPTPKAIDWEYSTDSLICKINNGNFDDFVGSRKVDDLQELANELVEKHLDEVDSAMSQCTHVGFKLKVDLGLKKSATDLALKNDKEILEAVTKCRYTFFLQHLVTALIQAGKIELAVTITKSTS